MRKSGPHADRGKDYLEKKPGKDERPATEESITTRVEPKQLEERLAIDAHVVYGTIHREGEEEKRRRRTASHGVSIWDGPHWRRDSRWIFYRGRLSDGASAGMGAGFGTVRMRAIFAGWLIALMASLLPGTESAGASIILILLIWLESVDSTTSFGIRDYGFFCWSLKSISRGTYITQFFFPPLLGNVIGGLALVAALGHAQMLGGKQEQGKAKG